jgi:hypothetical protein
MVAIQFVCFLKRNLQLIFNFHPTFLRTYVRPSDISASAPALARCAFLRTLPASNGGDDKGNGIQCFGNGNLEQLLALRQRLGSDWERYSSLCCDRSNTANTDRHLEQPLTGRAVKQPVGAFHSMSSSMLI